MRKKTTVYLSLLCLLFLGVACTSTQVEPETTVPTETGTVAFEEATIRPLFDSYCASCHGVGNSNYKDWPYVPANYSVSIKGYISKIYNQVYTTKAMPENGKLTSAQLTAFKAWYDAGYPAK